MKARLALLLIAATLVAIGVWSIRNRGRHPGQKPPGTAPAHKTTQTVPIQDGKTLDFSSGHVVVKDTSGDRAALAKGVTAMEAAAADVQFTAPAKP